MSREVEDEAFRQGRELLDREVDALLARAHRAREGHRLDREALAEINTLVSDILTMREDTLVGLRLLIRRELGP